MAIKVVIENFEEKKIVLNQEEFEKYYDEWSRWIAIDSIDIGFDEFVRRRKAAESITGGAI